MTVQLLTRQQAVLPGWLPQAVRHYLEHTEFGVPIRELARSADMHASTILRQIRKFETRRDDPLVDEALKRLASASSPQDFGSHSSFGAGADQSIFSNPDTSAVEKLTRDSQRVLRRMAEPGAVLAVARDMEKGVVVREAEDQSTQRLAVVDRDLAQSLALREWIDCSDPEARIGRYRITGAGRSALKEMVAAQENLAQGFAEAETAFAMTGPSMSRARMPLIDSPLNGLARRRTREGRPFLGRDLVAAGERLREDYELSRLNEGGVPDWLLFLSDPGQVTLPKDENKDPDRACGRVAAALGELGPGLGDVALRACCLLEGMESLEKRMGWSARSGKIVLRIALQRLNIHYRSQHGGLGPKIG